jgi:phosphocarrier protein
VSVVEKTVPIVNRLGLHARAAAKLMTLAARYNADVTISKGDKVENGKSIMGILKLGAAQGSSVTLIADGDDAEEAVHAMAELIAARFDEEA